MARKSKLIKSKLIIMLYFVTFLASLIFILLGGYIYMIGSHNLDLAQNLDEIEARYGITLGDLHSDFKIHTYDEMYVNGANQQRTGLFYLLVGSFCLGGIYMISKPSFL